MDENTREPILSILTLIVETAARLLRDGHRVIIVSSGAVGVGLRRMDVDRRPKHLPAIQVRPQSEVCWSSGDWTNLSRAVCLGFGSCWTMSVDEHLGQPVCPSAAAHRSDSSYEERYCGCKMYICLYSKLSLTNEVQRTQYVNAQNTFKELLNMGVIPIVNENDTLAVSVSLLALLVFNM